MAGLRRFQYIGKDYSDIIEDCVARIKEAYPDKWNDFYEDSAGMMLIEVFAYVADLLLFYLERQANETYLPTATERQNLLNMCKLVGYRVSNARPAEAGLLFTLRQPHARDISIPEGTVVESAGGIAFETSQETRIPSGSSEATCGAVEGETFDERIGYSTGAAGQEFYLPRAAVIEIIAVNVDGMAWAAVDSLADQDGSERAFMADIDAFGRARIMFGDGMNGRIPETDAEISAVYRIGGGTRGNVAANTINSMRGIVTDETGERVSVSVTNPSPASGGAGPESIERIRMWAPRYFEAQNRCVTQADYETVAMTFQDPNAGAIAKARAVVRERSGEANVIRYYVLAYAEDPGRLALASQSLKDALLKHVNERKMFTDWIEIEDGAWRTVDIRGTLRLTPGVPDETAVSRAKKALQSLVNAETQRMGGKLRISDVYSALDNVEGVESVELETPAATVSADTNEVLLLGDVEFAIESGSGDGTNT
ncbi:MAG: baseplate J/gp47 family protein [Synergistaceae bacterium]|nr:baseplate J/gp47 family protein [Synergistaceae bacterium]